MASEVLKGRRILIIDDDIAIATVVKQGLEYLGCTVAHGPTGEIGVEMAKSDPPDLIVLDISLPNIDGFEVCRQLKAEPTTEPVPVIFLSALNETKERVRGLRLGAIDYMVKPFDMDELIERIDIGLRIKGVPMRSSVETEQPVERTEQEEEKLVKPKTAREVDVLGHDKFLGLLEDRYRKLDPENGLLTLAFIRIDQEDQLMGDEHTELRQKIQHNMFTILDELCPDGTLFGTVSSFQVGALIPRKNKYGAELILDELSNLLALQDFHSENEIAMVTLSRGVAEVPSPVIGSAKEFEEIANSALQRAVHSGGDRTVLL